MEIPTDKWQAELNTYQRRLLNTVLRLCAFGALLAISQSIINVYKNPETWPREWPFFSIYLAVFGVAFFRKLDRSVRILVGSGGIYITAIIIIARSGVISIGTWYLFLGPLLAFPLLGFRKGICLIGLSIAIFGVFAFTHYYGIIEITVHPDPRQSYYLLDALTAYALVIGVISSTQGVFYRHQQDLLTRLTQLHSELLQHHTQLEVMVEQRTKQLASAKLAAENANQAKTSFLANVSHELRTPLNSILGHAQILKRSHSTSPKQAESIHLIEQSGEHLLLLINDILDCTTFEAHKLILTPTTAHFPSFLETVAALIRTHAQQKGITFNCDFSADLPTYVHIDTQRLRQVLLNLLNNAIKFTAAGSVTLQVHLDEVTPNNSPDTAKIHFAVHDTGCGIDETDIPYLFQPFERGRHPAQCVEGTGLGLTISQQIIEAQHSHINVSSEIDVGSTFWFDIALPVKTDPPTLIEQPHHAIIGYKGPRRELLIVDDHPQNRSVLINLLEPLGFTLQEAENGSQALDIVSQQKPDLILLDLVMPEMSGTEVAQAIQKQSKSHNYTPPAIIAVSAGAFDQDRRQSLLAGCNAFLPKPIDVEDLFTLIAQHLHLQWIIADTTQPTPEKLQIPPAEILQELRELLQQGRFLEIADYPFPTECQDFGMHIQKLANEFESAALQKLLS